MDRKYKNKLNYILTIIVVIIVYLIIYIYGKAVREDIYLEKQGYENNANVPPINNIISIVKNDTPIDEEINSLSFARKNVSVKIGDTMKLIVNVNPTSLSSTKLTWESSDPSVVSVDSKGNIKGLKEGTAIITVTSPNGKQTTVKITVVKDEVKTEKIITNPKALSLDVGSLKQIDATIEPENATNGNLKWESSNPKVATVDENGVVKGISPGTTVITVKTKDGTVSTKITVIVRDKTIVEVGGSKQIDPDTITKPSGVTNDDLVWESSNPYVAKVDENGVITGVSPGTATITVKTKDGEIIDQITVVVKDKITVAVGATKQIDPNTITKPSGVTNNDLVWESSNPSIAKVDKNGVVTGISPGTTTIIVKTKDGKVIDKITVIVKDKITVDVGETEQIDPNTINKPSGVTNNDLVWESSNPSVATVDENGVVTGVSPGTTTVIVKTKDGDVIDQITVVVEPETTPTDIVFLYDYDPSNYIDLYNQFPIKDEVGKNLQGNKRTQDFKIRFNSGAVGVRYTITMEKLDGSDLEEDWTKAFLVRDGSDVSNCFRSTGRVKTFNEYINYKGNPKEKILYEGVVSSSMATRGYEEYTFRMWVSEDVRLYNEDYVSKTFKTRINVYAQSE